MITQENVTSQKGSLLNCFKSESLNFSSSDISSVTPSFLAAHASIQTNKKAIKREKQQMKKPTKRAKPTL